jgi:Rad3-related DNA helicase
VFLIDEAHNLVERACEMYSAVLKKEDFMAVKKLIPMYSKKLLSALEACNKELLKYKRNCDEIDVFTDLGDAGSLVIFLMRAITRIDEFNKEHPGFEHKETLMNLYFDMRHFVNIYEIIDDDYLIYTSYDEIDNFIITLRCMNPARNLSYQLKKGKSAVFFSATLLPIKYYMNQLSAKEDDYAVYAPSTFDKSKRNIMIANDVSTKYTRRNDYEYRKIARYIEIFTKEKLSFLNPSALIIDLASKPGGVDFESASLMGIKTIWALSLPGKVAPVTSGEIIAKTIRNILTERGEN